MCEHSTSACNQHLKCHKLNVFKQCYHEHDTPACGQETWEQERKQLQYCDVFIISNFCLITSILFIATRTVLLSSITLKQSDEKCLSRDKVLVYLRVNRGIFEKGSGRRYGEM